MAVRSDRHQLIVELHDVAPPFERQIREQLTYLTRAGVHRVVLMVVPNWHGRFPIANCRSLIDLLHRQNDAGSEVVLHGIEHRSRGPLRGSAAARLRAALFASETAEFLTLECNEAYESLAEGIRTLQEIGLPRPVTFCAPGWLLAPDLAPVVGQVGIQRIAGMFFVRDLHAGASKWLPGTGYMGAHPLHETGVQILNRIVGGAGTIHPRISKAYLHPQSSDGNPAVKRVLDAIVNRIRSDDCEVTTYADADLLRSL